jgi:type I restriction enzyme S subunit
MNELKDIPKHWKIGRLEHLLDYIQPTEFIVESTEYNDAYKVPVLTAGKSFIKGYTNETEGIFNNLPVIIFDDFTTANKFVNFPFKVKSSAMKILKAKDENSNIMFAFYYMQTLKVSTDTHKRYWISVFSKLQIPLPPLSEQQAIVAKIEELLSELDNGKQQLLTAQQQLKVYRQSLLKWAFEGKLTNKNVKEGELPKGWKKVKIVDIAENNKHSLKAGPFGSSLKKEFYVQKGYKIYGQEQVIIDNPFFGDYYVNEEKYQELKSCRVKPFDILISLVGTVGKVLILPENCEEGVINPRLIKITLNKEVYLHKFFKYYFESSYVKNFYGAKAQGTTMDVLNLGIIKTIPFPLPTIKEQQQIVEELESKLTVCDKIEETISQSLQQAETLRQSILKKAFEGRLVTSKK